MIINTSPFLLEEFNFILEVNAAVLPFDHTWCASASPLWPAIFVYWGLCQTKHGGIGAWCGMVHSSKTDTCLSRLYAIHLLFSCLQRFKLFTIGTLSLPFLFSYCVVYAYIAWGPLVVPVVYDYLLYMDLVSSVNARIRHDSVAQVLQRSGTHIIFSCLLRKSPLELVEGIL